MKFGIGIFVCGLVFVIASFALLNELGTAPLERYDEGTYAQVVAESIERNDFLTFTYQGEIFYDKPPLYFWIAGVMTTLTGDPVLGIRLPAALAGIGVIAVVMLLAYTFTRNYFIAALAGLLLISTQPFIDGAREARLDVLISFCILLSFYFVYIRRYLLFGLFLGLAILAKSVIAIFALVAVAAYLLYLRTWPQREFWWGIGLCVLVAAPWHMYEWFVHGSVFWEQYIGVHVFERYEKNLFGDPNLQTDYLFHLKEFAPLLSTAFVASLAALPIYWRNLAVYERAVLCACVVTALAMILVFFTSQTRAFSYLIPLYPFAALSCALSLWHLVSIFKK